MVLSSERQNQDRLAITNPVFTTELLYELAKFLKLFEPVFSYERCTNDLVRLLGGPTRPYDPRAQWIGRAVVILNIRGVTCAAAHAVSMILNGGSIKFIRACWTIFRQISSIIFSFR